jgi:SAM-dependent methyltransferase
MKCRICKKDSFYKYLDLGQTPPADDFLVESRLDQSEIFYPLRVQMCNECGLHHLDYIVPPEILYQNEYPYESSTTKTGRDHFHGFAKHVKESYSLLEKSLVIDIGSNVGVLLEGFKKLNLQVLGIDPAQQMCEIANANGIETINAFFNLELVKKIVKEHGKASIVTGTNVIAHIDNHHEMMKSICHLLDDNGLFIFEAPYLLDLVENLEYDTIYHEHLAYLSVKPVKYLVEQFGLEIVNIEKVKIHGGSLRYYISRKGKNPVGEIVKKYLINEEKTMLYNHSRLNQFAVSVREHKMKLINLLLDLKEEGASIAGLSAPAKGMTLLNYCNIDNHILDFVTEKSMLKIGKYTPGTHIPIFDDNKLIEKMPNYALILAWNFANEIMQNLSEYRQKGGKFIIPIPEPKIV